MPLPCPQYLTHCVYSKHILLNELMALFSISLRKWKQLEENLEILTIFIYTLSCTYTLPSLVTVDELFMLLPKENSSTYPPDHIFFTLSNIVFTRLFSSEHMHML